MTLEKFLEDNGVTFADMVLLGSGENGTAWRCDELVIKQTSSEWEWDFAVKQTEGEWPLFATVYATAKNDEHYFYIAEYLEKSDNLESYFYMLDVMLASQNIEPFEAYRFDYQKYLDKYKRKDGSSPISKTIEDLYLKIVALSKEYKRIGASDLHPGNLGYDQYGNLKAFDIDLNNEEKDEIIFKQTGKVSMY